MNNAHGFTEGSDMPEGPKVTFHKDQFGKPYAKADFSNVPPIAMTEDKSPEAKHTPGPWEVITDGYYVQSPQVVGDHASQLVALLYGRNHDERKSNAELIARAPELSREVERLKQEIELTNNAINEVLSETAKSFIEDYKRKALNPPKP